jgi:hypothetical protein
MDVAGRGGGGVSSTAGLGESIAGGFAMLSPESIHTGARSKNAPRAHTTQPRGPAGHMGPGGRDPALGDRGWQQDLCRVPSLAWALWTGDLLNTHLHLLSSPEHREPGLPPLPCTPSEHRQTATVRDPGAWHWGRCRGDGVWGPEATLPPLLLISKADLTSRWVSPPWLHSHRRWHSAPWCDGSDQRWFKGPKVMVEWPWDPGTLVFRE